MNSSSCSTSSGRNSDSDENNSENYPRLSDNSQKISCLKILLGRAQSACVQNESVENILSHLNEMRSYLNELRVNILIEERNTNNASQVLSLNSSQITHINQTDVAGSVSDATEDIAFSETVTAFEYCGVCGCVVPELRRANLTRVRSRDAHAVCQNCMENFIDNTIILN